MTTLMMRTTYLNDSNIRFFPVGSEQLYKRYMSTLESQWAGMNPAYAV